MDAHSQNTFKLYSDFFSITNLIEIVWWQGLPDDPRISEIDFDLKRYLRLVRYYLHSLKNGNPPTSSLINFLYSEREKIEEKLLTTPNSIDKAKEMLRAYVDTSRFSTDNNDVYDAVVYLRDEIDNSLVNKIANRWRDDYKSHIEHLAKYSDLDDWHHSKIFWFVRTGIEDTELISRYRAKIYLNIGGFDDVFEEVEEWAENYLRDLIQDPFDHLAEYHLGMMVDFLCTISRDQYLVSHLADMLRLALRHLAKGSIPKEWAQYTAELEREKNPNSHHYLLKFNQRPAMDVMVLSALALSRLSSNEKTKQKATEAATWLLRHQHEKGFWSKRWDPETGSITNTVYALETLIRNNLQGIEYSIDKGIDWLISKQNEYGCWEELRFFPVKTVKVLEIIDLANAWKNKPLATSQDLQNLSSPVISKTSFTFICHSSRDDEFVDQLIADLENANFLTWVDHKNISVLENWNNSIAKALDECTSLLFVVTQNGLDSQECQREWSYVLNNKPVIMVILDSTLKLPHRLHLNNGVKFDKSYANGLKKLISDLQSA